MKPIVMFAGLVIILMLSALVIIFADDYKAEWQPLGSPVIGPAAEMPYMGLQAGDRVRFVSTTAVRIERYSVPRILEVLP